MKLLGWMHRKFRQSSSGDPLRDFIAGHACNCLSSRTSLDDSYQQSPRLSRRTLRPVQDRWLILPDEDTVHNVDYLAPAADPDEEYVDYDAPNATELFHGLLAIGTLGSADVDSVGAVTPTFGGPAPAPPLQLQSVVDAIAEKEEKEVATESDLMLINAELEKVLFAMEATDKAGSEAVDLERFSSVSAKQLVVISPAGGLVSAAAAACPLQEYLLGSPVGVAETVETAARPGRERKELQRRTSLGELFMRSRALEGGATDGTGRVGEKDKSDKPAAAKVHLLVKKMLMRRRSGKSSSSVPETAYGVSVADGDYKEQPEHCITSSDTKFHKIMQMFHRKVHPENIVAAKKAMKLTTEKGKNKLPHVHGGGIDSCFAGGGLGNNSKSIKRGVSLEKDNYSTCMNCSMSLDACVGGRSANSSGNREHWIKTDADYLVLEL